MENTSEYREIIERFARDRVDARVPNGLPLHASILIETMFKSAVAEMRVFSRELDEKVFGRAEIKAAVERFTGKPYSNLMILLQKPHDEAWIKNHPLIRALLKTAKHGAHGDVIVRNAYGSYAKDDANHFSVMDNDGFRFETDHENTKAVANFNEPKTAKKLVAAFNLAFDISAKEHSKPLFELKHSDC